MLKIHLPKTPAISTLVLSHQSLYNVLHIFKRFYKMTFIFVFVSNLASELWRIYRKKKQLNENNPLSNHTEASWLTSEGVSVFLCCVLRGCVLRTIVLSTGCVLPHLKYTGFAVRYVGYFHFEQKKSRFKKNRLENGQGWWDCEALVLIWQYLSMLHWCTLQFLKKKKSPKYILFIEMELLPLQFVNFLF